MSGNPWEHKCSEDMGDIVVGMLEDRCSHCGKERPAIQRQEGGDHYKGMAIQPVEYVHKNGLGFIEGSVVKYVSRWRAKGGVEDLKKARHFLDLLIEFESVDKKL